MALQKVVVRRYTRPGCHLCDDAREQMLAANCADLYELEEINIDENPELVKSYGILIPVIWINGIEVFRHRVSAGAFRDAVRKSR